MARRRRIRARRRRRELEDVLGHAKGRSEPQVGRMRVTRAYGSRIEILLPLDNWCARDALTLARSESCSADEIEIEIEGCTWEWRRGR